MAAADKHLRVIIADDHILLRHGITNILAQNNNLEIVGEFSSGKELLIHLKENEPEFNLYVMLKFLSSEYQLDACGKNFSHSLTLNENHHFAKGSQV